MPTTVECPNCHARLKAPDTSIGKTVACPKCKSPFVVQPNVDSPDVITAAAVPPPLAPSQSTPTKRCPFCAEQIAVDAIKCRYCSSMLLPIEPHSQRIESTSKQINPSSPPKDPLLMALLSGCCIAGLGQIVLGQETKGVVFLIGAIVLSPLTMGLSILVIWPLMGIDAYMVAKKLKTGRPVTEWECFPS